MEKHILVVEDDEDARSALMRMLRCKGFVTHGAQDGQEGLDYWLENRDLINLVISDNRMPIMLGIEMLQSIMAIKPATKAIILSGTTDDISESILPNVPRASKPVHFSTIERHLVRAFCGIG
jgi:DNA-binding NtrC family response regulator